MITRSKKRNVNFPDFPYDSCTPFCFPYDSCSSFCFHLCLCILNRAYIIRPLIKRTKLICARLQPPKLRPRPTDSHPKALPHKRAPRNGSIFSFLSLFLVLSPFACFFNSCTQRCPALLLQHRRGCKVGSGYQFSCSYMAKKSHQKVYVVI